MGGATLARRDATNDVGSIFHHLLRVERSFFACQSLNYQARIFVNQNTHSYPIFEF
jgi:hypothetical protein